MSDENLTREEVQAVIRMTTPDPTLCGERIGSSALLERVVRDVLERYGKEPRHEWTTWDVFAGRHVRNIESFDSYLSRLIREAFERSRSNKQISD